MNEEIEDIQLKIQGLASCLDRDELYSVCEKLKIEKLDFEGKPRFATVRVLTKEIEKLVDNLKDTEKVPFLKQTLEIINPKSKDTEAPSETFAVDEEVKTGNGQGGLFTERETKERSRSHSGAVCHNNRSDGG